MDDKALRKAWLKRKFSSFEYHEEMVRLHEQWRKVLRTALARAEADTQSPSTSPTFKNLSEEAKHFRKRYMEPIIEREPSPGDYRPDTWPQYRATGMFRSIPDYSRYLISEGDMLAWMTEAESAELGRYWGPMAQMASNIRRTVDRTWNRRSDDVLLDEEITGPIEWPTNWRDDVADLDQPSAAGLRCEANHPCPREGYWSTPAKAGSRRHFSLGEVMPALTTDYGATIWHWDENQG